MPRISLLALQHGCLVGAVNGVKTYHQWSGDTWHPTESLLQVEIARHLIEKKLAKYVTMEEHVRYLTKTTVRGRGRRPTRLAGGRFDLCAWWHGDNHPRVVIEVKRAKSAWSPTRDVRRMQTLLQRSGGGARSLQAGIQVCYSAARRAGTLEQRFASIRETCQLHSRPKVSEIESAADGLYWGVCVYVVRVARELEAAT